jgi:hypothetical protein
MPYALIHHGDPSCVNKIVHACEQGGFVSNQISMFTRPFWIVVNFTMTEKAKRHHLFEIIQSLSISPCEMMAFGGDVATELTLEMLSQEREPQPAIFPQPGLPYSTGSVQPRLWTQWRFAFQGA